MSRSDPKPLAGGSFSGRLGIVQRVLAGYRKPFFEKLAKRCVGGLAIAAGSPLPGETIIPAASVEGATVTQLRNLRVPLGGSLYWQHGLLEWLAQAQPDAVIVEANPRLLSTRHLTRWMHRRGRPVLGWGLGTDWGERRGGVARRLVQRRLLGRFDAVIAYSKRAAADYQAAGLPEHRVFIAPNATMARPEGPMPLRPPHVRRAHVLFVGRLIEGKRIDDLLTACAGLPQEIQPLVTIVGDGPLRSRFQRNAEAVYPEARFVGAQRGDSLERWWAEADVFVLPGLGGLAVQEALGHGLPIIAAEGDGTPADLVGPDNGWLIQLGDVPALTRALAAAVGDVGALRRMGEASFQAAQSANIDIMADRFVEALTTVIDYSVRR